MSLSKALFAFFTAIFTFFGNGILNLAGAQSTDISVGLAQIEITPQQEKYPHYRGTSTGTDDPLFVKTAVFREGNIQSAIVICDLLWIARDLSADVRIKASQLTGIPFTNIIISATHSHTTPAYDDNIRSLNAENRKIDDYKGNPDDYKAWLAGQMVKSIAEAQKNCVPATLKTGKSTVENIAFNRRFILKDGKTVMNPGVGNTSAITMAGPTDPELGIVLIERKSDNKLIGGLSNFAVHSDTYGGTKFSADYPGVLARQLQKKYGEEFISVFGLGACGNLNHVDVRNSTNKLNTAKIGETLAEKFVSGAASLTTANGKLQAGHRFVYLPLQNYTTEELAFADNKIKPLYPDSPFLTKRRLLKIKSLEAMRQTEAIPPSIGTEPWHIPLEVQAFTIGKDMAVVGLPGELFVEFALAVKEKSPFRNTIIIELTHSHIAYVPTIEAFKQGSYETINSRLHPGGGEALAENAIQLLNQLYADLNK